MSVPCEIAVHFAKLTRQWGTQMKLRLQWSISSACWIVVDDDDSTWLQRLFRSGSIVFRGTEQDCRDFIERMQK